jgi:uncharacterized protein
VRVAITGATGFIGSALADAITRRGGSVTAVSRSPGGRGKQVAQWDPARGEIDAGALEGHDAVVHLAGENLAGVWTKARKRRIRESRVQGTELIARTVAGLARPPAVLISGSGMNYYGDRGVTPVDESEPPADSFLAEVCVAWEAATAAAADAGIRVAFLRTSNVLHPSGGFLETILPVFRLGLGARFGSGSQFMPWITRDDMVRAILHLADRSDLRGPFNMTAPQAVTNAEFTDTLAEVLGRPSFLAVPGFAAKLAPGGMAEELLLPSLKLVPKRLLESGFDFRWPTLREALAEML